MNKEAMLDTMINRYGFENDWVVWFANELEHCKTDKDAEFAMWYAETQIHLDMVFEERL